MAKPEVSTGEFLRGGGSTGGYHTRRKVLCTRGDSRPNPTDRSCRLGSSVRLDHIAERLAICVFAKIQTKYKVREIHKTTNSKKCADFANVSYF